MAFGTVLQITKELLSFFPFAPSAPDTWTAVLFHHLTDGKVWRHDDPLIRGLDVDISMEQFEHRIRWLARHYEICSLDAITTAANTRPGKRPRLLICFDDGYASVPRLAAPLLHEIGAPWCFFINPAFIDNKELPIDNLAAYICNVAGMKKISEMVGLSVKSPKEFIGTFLSSLEHHSRLQFVEELAAKMRMDLESVRQRSDLFATTNEIAALAKSGVEIGNHTLHHVHCRTLTPDQAETEIRFSARAIEAISGRPVRAFAYPYGSIKDATPVAQNAIKAAGHKVAFLVHNRLNRASRSPYLLCRIDIGAMNDLSAAIRLGTLPKVRQLLRPLPQG